MPAGPNILAPGTKPMALRTKATPAPAPQRTALVKNEMAASGSSSTKLGDKPDKTDLFNLMVVRAAKAVEPSVLQATYIHDRHPRYNNEMVRWLDVDLQSPSSESVVGHIVYEAVFCGPLPDADTAQDYLYQQLVIAILALLTPYYAPCDNLLPPPAPGNLPPLPLQVADLERHANISYNGFWYLLPDQIDLIAGFPALKQVRATQRVLAAAATAAASSFDVNALRRALAAIWGVNDLATAVFIDGNYALTYAACRRCIFDAMYFLYVLRRKVDCNFDDLIAALRALHTLEALAIDSFVASLVGTGAGSGDTRLLATLAVPFPVLASWDRSALPEGFPLVTSQSDLANYLQADAVIHPLFARLFYYKQPFNDIKPLGIGDLKVVKQWLVGYIPGEISDIHNIMLNENKTRTHRRMEKTDQTFTFTSDQSQESTKDVQSTDRFEVKREAQNIIKSDLNVNANASVQYHNGPITANVGGGVAYGRSSTDDTKTAQNYARDVVSRAVTTVQSRTTETRTVTQIFQTWEFNKHEFNNIGGPGHISGIYRWLDKEYKAQLYNFGKRLMFEFVLPEPAAFYVESRLRAYEVSVDCPQPPPPPQYQVLTMSFGPSDIDYNKFNDLRKQYDLSEFTFPISPRNVPFIDGGTNQDSFREDDLQGASDEKWYFKTFQCSVGAQGYLITDISDITGQIYFLRTKGPGVRDEPYFKIFIGGTEVFFADYHDDQNQHPNIEFPIEGPITGTNLPLLMTSDTVNLTLGFQNIAHYALAVVATIQISDQAMLDWQTQVYNKIRGILQKQVDDANNQIMVAYNAAQNNYQNQLQNIQSTVINDLIQGRSEAFNADVMRTELKRQCLSFLAKEFDANSAEWVLTDLETMGSQPVDFTYRTLVVHENNPTPPSTSVSIDQLTHRANYPLPDVPAAQRKGRYVQFLEQAFEWEELSYIFYPYFWTTPPKWVSVMNRNDATDPNLTAFLQAGAARVLLAVTPAYDTAVLHFLATREPWNGGQAPVIGDPLFLPLYEELKNEQDDLLNAVPEGDPWTFRLPTTLVYLEGSTTKLPDYPQDPPS